MTGNSWKPVPPQSWAAEFERYRQTDEAQRQVEPFQSYVQRAIAEMRQEQQKHGREQEPVQEVEHGR